MLLLRPEHILLLCRHVHAGLVLFHNICVNAAQSDSPLLPVIATTAHPCDGLLWVQMLPASAAHELVLLPVAFLPPTHYGCARRQAAFCPRGERGEIGNVLSLVLVCFAQTGAIVQCMCLQCFGRGLQPDKVSRGSRVFDVC